MKNSLPLASLRKFCKLASQPSDDLPASVASLPFALRRTSFAFTSTQCAKLSTSHDTESATASSLNQSTMHSYRLTI